MSCLTHHRKLRSSLHNLINEFRKENYLPASILMLIPRQCCTCKSENNDIIEIEIVNDEYQLKKFKKIIELVNQEKQTSPKLILSLNYLIKFIEKNRNTTTNLSESKSIRRQQTSNSSILSNRSSLCSKYVKPMKASRRAFRPDKQPKQIETKPIKKGTFIFLPYGANDTRGSKCSYYEMLGRELQFKYFYARGGHITDLEKQHNIRINIITRKTSAEVTKALEAAMQGLENLEIHNRKEAIDISSKIPGEWALVRSKKPDDQTNPADFEQALNDLINRWESGLKVVKRMHETDDALKSLTPKKK